MLKELFDAIQEQQKAALRPEIIPIPGQVPHITHLAMPDGTMVAVYAEPPYRDHQAFDLATLCEWAKRTEADDPFVWYSRDGVVLFLEDGNRRDKVQLELHTSQQLEKLEKIEASRPAFDQKGLINLLRIDFRDCLQMCGNLVDVIRKVKFRQAQTGEAEIQHGKSSVGRALMSELTGQGSIPETITLPLPVFKGNFPCPATVDCALEIDSATEKFWLIPFPGEIERAYLSAEAAIALELGDRLADTGVPIFYGQP